MPRVLTLAQCPNCGAPVNVTPGAFHVICVYCNQSLSVAPGPGSRDAELSPEGVPPLEVARVKDLLLDGKRDEAILNYMRVAAIPRSEAEAAVEALAIESNLEFTRHLPLRPHGFVLHFLILLFVSGLGALCV